MAGAKEAALWGGLSLCTHGNLICPVGLAEDKTGIPFASAAPEGSKRNGQFQVAAIPVWKLDGHELVR